MSAASTPADSSAEVAAGDPAGEPVEIFCPDCGYDLRTLEGDTCPECGGAIDREALARSQIPWSHRREIGRVRAFWRTVWLVTWRTPHFAREIARPVEYRDARRFHLVLVLWVALAVVPAWLALVNSFIGSEAFEDLHGITWFNRMALFVAAVQAFIWLYTVTALHTYWFHPRWMPIERQNRSLALSWYAAAPLAFAPPLAAMLLVAAAVFQFGEETRSRALWWIGFGLTLGSSALLAATPVAFWHNCLSLARSAAGRGGLGRAVMAVVLPAIWVAWTFLLLVLIPAALAWVGVVVYTLTT